MKNQLLRLVTRLALLSILLAAFASIATVANADDYFSSFYGCTNVYYGRLGYCRSTTGYPYYPDEAECRYLSYSSYWECRNRLPMAPILQLDFCDNARAARDHCILNYLGDNDIDTYYACYDASGIGYCE